MALRPGAVPFTPGAGGPQPSPSPVASSKQTAYPPSSSSSPQIPTPSSCTATQTFPSKTSVRPPVVRIKGSPRGNQGKRGQTQRKAEQKSRITDDLVLADPTVDAVPPLGFGVTNRKGYVWVCESSWSDFVESSVELFDGAEGTSQLFESFPLS